MASQFTVWPWENDLLSLDNDTGFVWKHNEVTAWDLGLLIVVFALMYIFGFYETETSHITKTKSFF